MASNAESQGKTIALVIFILLTIVGGSLAYYFYDQVDRLNQTAADAKKNETAAKNEAKTRLDQYTELRQIVAGAANADDHARAIELMRTELKTPKINDVRRGQKSVYETYQGAVAYLQSELEESDRRVAELSTQKDKLEQDLKAVKGQYQQDVDTAISAQKSKEDELASETKTLMALNSEKDERINVLTQRVGKANDELTQLRRDLADAEKRSTQLLKDLRLIIEDQRRQLARNKVTQFEKADGEIVSVERDGQYAVVNLGFDDGLRNGTTFAVYGIDAAGNPNKNPKANLEIVRIIDRHQAKAQVTNQTLTNPIMPGDRIQNPIWDRGDKEGIAMAGLFFLDDDRGPDNEAFKRMVEANGGKIDAEVNIKTGQIIGAITVDTRWLVIGDTPEYTENPDLQGQIRQRELLEGAISKMKREAEDHGVRIVSLKNFLTYMGNNLPPRTVPAGAEYRLLYERKNN